MSRQPAQVVIIKVGWGFHETNHNKIVNNKACAPCRWSTYFAKTIAAKLVKNSPYIVLIRALKFIISGRKINL